MTDIGLLTNKLEMASRRTIALMVGSAYIFLVFFAFLALSLFLNSFLVAVVESQHYSLAIQEWRGVLNGVNGGWSFFPPLESLCIRYGSEIALSQGSCPDPMSIAGWMSGRYAEADYNNISILVSLQYSLWWWALVAPFLAFVPIALTYRVLKRPIIERLNLELLEQLNAMSSDQQQLPVIQSAVRIQMEEIINLRKQSALGRMAAQVSHDIRSPLGSLSALIHSAQGLDEQSRIQMRTAISRIRDIANGLLAKNRENPLFSIEADAPSHSGASLLSSEPKSKELLFALVESAVSQKRLQFREREEIKITLDVSPLAASVFSEVQATELFCMISNIINNSAEAFEGDGEVKISLTRDEGRSFLRFEDNGKGIPAELLAKVVEHGGTFGKKDGNGLGLSHAKATIESWGGALRLESVVNKGTTVIFEMLLSEPAEWFADKIYIPPNIVIVIVDDDPLVHQLWDLRLGQCAPSNQRVHLRASTEFLEWYRENMTDKGALYLCDYEFSGHKLTGFDVIEMTGVASRAILMTNLWDDRTLQNRCIRAGIKILPKTMLEVVWIGAEANLGCH